MYYICCETLLQVFFSNMFAAGGRLSGNQNPDQCNAFVSP